MNRIVRMIGGRMRRVSWLSWRKPDGTRYAVACVANGDRPLIAVWEGDREPDDDDVVEAVRARLDEDARPKPTKTDKTDSKPTAPESAL